MLLFLGVIVVSIVTFFWGGPALAPAVALKLELAPTLNPYSPWAVKQKDVVMMV